MRCLICWSLASGLVTMLRRYAQENSLGAINPDEVALAEKQALTPFARDGAEGPYQRHEPSGWLSCGQ
jgi:hypothetical protein